MSMHAQSAPMLLFHAMLLMMLTVCFVPVFNPRSGNPTKYKGNLNQKLSDLRAAPMPSSVVDLFALHL